MRSVIIAVLLFVGCSEIDYKYIDDPGMRVVSKTIIRDKDGNELCRYRIKVSFCPDITMYDCPCSMFDVGDPVTIAKRQP